MCAQRTNKALVGFCVFAWGRNILISAQTSFPRYSYAPSLFGPYLRQKVWYEGCIRARRLNDKTIHQNRIPIDQTMLSDYTQIENETQKAIIAFCQ